MTRSEHAQETGKRLLREYLDAANAARNQLPLAQVLEPGKPITPFPLTLEKIAEWNRLDAAADEAKARWRAWLSDPEGYSGH
jgi:hypothetical protein